MSRQCAHRWINRFDEAGDDGLEDRSSRPHTSPNQTAPDVEEKVLAARREHRSGPDQLCYEVGVPARGRGGPQGGLAGERQADPPPVA
ncbi:MAG: helix-turn-helix domain-containing protein [Ilumatobacteraceae bacterium]